MSAFVGSFIGAIIGSVSMFVLVVLPLTKKYNKLVEIKNRLVKRRQEEFKSDHKRNLVLLDEIKERLERIKIE